MLKANSRTESNHGLRFFEQDIVMLDYLFSGDCEISVAVNYQSPGIGILFAEGSGNLSDINSAYLVRLGYDELSVVRKRLSINTVLAKNSCVFASPQAEATFVVSLRGKHLEVRSGNYVMGSCMLDKNISDYQLGIYSSAGNTVTAMTVLSGSPENWIVNMKNTVGGHIRFVDDGFIVTGCSQDAELQTTFLLQPQDYYLGYQESDDSNLTAYMFPASDTRNDDSVKNRLENGRITVAVAEPWILKFKGLAGTISQIGLKNKPHEDYVPTENAGSVSLEGSKLIVDMAGVDEIEWVGTIHAIPDIPLTEVQAFAVISSGANRIQPMHMDYELGENLLFRFVKSTRTFYANGFSLHLGGSESDTRITLFENVSGLISSLKLTLSNGEEQNCMVRSVRHLSLPGAIRGPIVVVGMDGDPLDLSSSYREISREGQIQYLFTNTERETFPATEQELLLEKTPASTTGSIVVYGIKPVSSRNRTAVFRMTSSVDTIDAYATHYDILDESLFTVDADSSSVLLSDEAVSRGYIEYVVDYVKEDSYCVNYLADTGAYQVEIVSAQSKVSAIYETQAGSDWKVNPIPVDTEAYIVLRKREA